MDKLVKIKFSLADWEYAVPGPYISDVVFVSPPSSLAAKDGAFNRQGWAMCKLAAAQNIVDGRILTQLRLGVIATPQIYTFYRAQANPVGAPPGIANTYNLWFYTTQVLLKRIVGGTAATLKTYTFSPALSISTWYYFRLTWWQYLGPLLTVILRHKLEQFKDGAWVELFYIDDSVNSFKDSAVNKVGFYLTHNSSTNPTAIDDTEIWKAIT